MHALNKKSYTLIVFTATTATPTNKLYGVHYLVGGGIGMNCEINIPRSVHTTRDKFIYFVYVCINKHKLLTIIDKPEFKKE